MTTSKDLFYQASVQAAKEQLQEMGVSLTLPLLREVGLEQYETVENKHVVDAAKLLYKETGEQRHEMTGAFVITKNKGTMFYTVDVKAIDKEPELEMEAMEDKPRAKPAVAKVGGGTRSKNYRLEVVKSKSKSIVDMTAAELKSLAKQHSIDFSTVNFRKADEKDAFRSKVAKVLGRSSEMNTTYKTGNN